LAVTRTPGYLGVDIKNLQKKFAIFRIMRTIGRRITDMGQ